MNVHLIDGTYELFRHHFGAPKVVADDGRQIGAVRSVLRSLLGLLEAGATHMAVATDHVIESFRNELWPGYKSGEGIDPELLAQFHPLEDALASLGVTVWPMTELEADDGLASGAALAARDARVEVVYICTPDKDLAQCVVGERVMQWDRRGGEVRDAEKIKEKFGVAPVSIPDYLALVGDAQDGFPGVPGWGAKSAATLLGRYAHLEDIPEQNWAWAVKVRGAKRLAERLRAHRADAFLFRELATLLDDAPLFENVDELEWRGPLPDFRRVTAWLRLPSLADRAELLAELRG